MPVDAIPLPRAEDNQIVLARGEVTGHKHAVRVAGVDSYVAGDGTYLVSGAPFPLEHIDMAGVLTGEHDTVIIPAGTVRILRQYTYDATADLPAIVAD